MPLDDQVGWADNESIPSLSTSVSVSFKPRQSEETQADASEVIYQKGAAEQFFARHPQLDTSGDLQMLATSSGDYFGETMHAKNAINLSEGWMG